MKLARDRLVTTGSTVTGSPWPWRQTFKHSSLSIAIIYSWLIQPYGMVSQKGPSLRFEPASLQSAIQLLNVLAMEAVNQYQSCQSKKELHFGDLNLQPSRLQSSALVATVLNKFFSWSLFTVGSFNLIGKKSNYVIRFLNVGKKRGLPFFP